jgi:hypothetical protein
MRRLQIQLTDEQEAAVRDSATRTGRSVAAVVRDAVERFVRADNREERIGRVMALAGKYRDKDGATDVATNHDRYLAEIYSQRKR